MRETSVIDRATSHKTEIQQESRRIATEGPRGKFWVHKNCAQISVSSMLPTKITMHIKNTSKSQL